MSSWYAVRTKPNSEFAVNRKLKADGLETFFPRNRCRSIGPRRHKVKWVEKPHFPTYLFAQAQPGQFDAIRKAGGNVVMFSGIPTPIPKKVMSVLKAGVDDTGLIKMSPHHHARCRFAAMSRVRFTSGPFANTLAQVILDDGGDLVHLMNALGKVIASAEDLVAA